MNVVIIDDDSDFCFLLKKLIEKNDRVIYTAHTIKDGLDLIDQLVPEIVFMDNFLPDGEAWKLARHIAKRYPHVNLNLVSGKDKSFYMQEDLDVNIWEKPITVDQVRNYFHFLKPSP